MSSGLAARNGGRAGLIALVAILLLGLGLRLDYAWDGRAPVYDARAYAAIAANLDRGHGFTVGAGATQPSSNYSPGLPLARRRRLRAERRRRTNGWRGSSWR